MFEIQMTLHPLHILDLDNLFENYDSRLGCRSLWDTLYIMPSRGLTILGRSQELNKGLRKSHHQAKRGRGRDRAKQLTS